VREHENSLRGGTQPLGFRAKRWGMKWTTRILTLSPPQQQTAIKTHKGRSDERVIISVDCNWCDMEGPLAYILLHFLSLLVSCWLEGVCVCGCDARLTRWPIFLQYQRQVQSHINLYKERVNLLNCPSTSRVHGITDSLQSFYFLSFTCTKKQRYKKTGQAAVNQTQPLLITA
jgi:hypothetical protein